MPEPTAASQSWSAGVEAPTRDQGRDLAELAREATPTIRASAAKSRSRVVLWPRAPTSRATST